MSDGTRQIRSDVAVDARGVAQVRLMLSDGTGPLYWGEGPRP